jgi:hypothetical protein
MCNLSFHETVLDLLEYTSVGSAWIANVTVKGDAGEGEGMLYYQPCAGMACPEGLKCEGDDQATVWLCQAGDCAGYGLFENNVTGVGIDVDEPYVEVHYIGDRHREALVNYRYEKEQRNGQLGMPKEVWVIGTALQFDVRTNKRFLPRDTRVSARGGAVFLIIVETIVVAYIGLGVVWVWITTGSVNLPNEDFWHQAWLSLQFVGLTVLTCCRPAHGEINAEKLIN